MPPDSDVGAGKCSCGSGWGAWSGDHRSAATMGLVAGPTALSLAGRGASRRRGLPTAGVRRRRRRPDRGGKDAYRMFNDFAEKAGIATKGLVSFSQALS